ncbi:MAG: hypothetical protein KDB23_32090, partial [Planctomycetales bacterium]|nr:hypothetical protein [Planctomycetales bacterium]
MITSRILQTCKCGLVCAMLLLNAALSTASAQDTTPVVGGTGRIIIEAHTDRPKLPDFYTANATTIAKLGLHGIEQEIKLSIRIAQGDANRLTFGLQGDDQIVDVAGDALASWSVRRVGAERFLDLHPKADARQLDVTVLTRSAELDLPSQVSLTHITPGDSVGFNSLVTLQRTAGVAFTVTHVDGFVPVGSSPKANQFQTATGGKIQIQLNRDSAVPGPVELTDTKLTGVVHAKDKSLSFRLSGTANVLEPSASVVILAGKAAVEHVATDGNYQLYVDIVEKRPVYKLVFPTAGKYDFQFEFVAPIESDQGNWRTVDFNVAAGAVVPLTLTGLTENLEFRRGTD